MLKSLFKNLSVFFLFSSFCYSDQVYLTLIQEISLNSIPKDIILHEGIAYVTTDGALYSFTTADPYNTQQNIYSNLNGTTSLAFSGRYGFTVNSGEVINIYDFTKKIPLKKEL